MCCADDFCSIVESAPKSHCSQKTPHGTKFCLVTIQFPLQKGKQWKGCQKETK